MSGTSNSKFRNGSTSFSLAQTGFLSDRTVSWRRLLVRSCPNPSPQVRRSSGFHQHFKYGLLMYICFSNRSASTWKIPETVWDVCKGDWMGEMFRRTPVRFCGVTWPVPRWPKCQVTAYNGSSFPECPWHVNISVGLFDFEVWEKKKYIVLGCHNMLISKCM